MGRGSPRGKRLPRCRTGGRIRPQGGEESRTGDKNGALPPKRPSSASREGADPQAFEGEGGGKEDLSPSAGLMEQGKGGPEGWSTVRGRGKVGRRGAARPPQSAELARSLASPANLVRGKLSSSFPFELWTPTAPPPPSWSSWWSHVPLRVGSCLRRRLGKQPPARSSSVPWTLDRGAP